jgi:REP element-mobilizing transposase RayT
LKGYDYSTPGYYFVTICTNKRKCLFGEITGDGMILNDAGKMVDKWFKEIENKYPHVKIDEYVIMPNHFHGKIIKYCRRFRTLCNGSKP